MSGEEKRFRLRFVVIRPRSRARLLADLPPYGLHTSCLRSLPSLALAMSFTTVSARSSPSSSTRSSDGLPFARNTSMSDFEVEHTAKTPHSPPKARRRRTSDDYDNETAFRASVATLLSSKTRPFTVSGRIPVDPSVLTLFFRSRVSVFHLWRSLGAHAIVL